MNLNKRSLIHQKSASFDEPSRLAEVASFISANELPEPPVGLQSEISPINQIQHLPTPAVLPSQAIPAIELQANIMDEEMGTLLVEPLKDTVDTTAVTLGEQVSTFKNK